VPSVLVLGGGYAGIAAVTRLLRRPGREWKITLVDRGEGHELQTRLPAVLAGRLTTEKAVIPFTRLLDGRVDLIHGAATAIMPAERAANVGAQTIRADHLVIAVGGTPDFLGIGGAAENCFVFKSVADAQALQGAIAGFDRSRPIHAVVVGAGYTGTEVAGELAHWPDRQIEVVVVADTDRLLQDGAERLGVVAQHILADAGVTFRLGVMVDRVTGSSVHLETGEEIPADIVVWAAHTSGAGATLDAPWRLTVDGRIVTEPSLQAAGFPRVWVAGDAAAIYDYRLDRPVPSSAQMAVEEGRLIADNILAVEAGLPPEEFRPVKLGEALTLGDGTGVADVGGVVVTGRAAGAAKEAALVRYLLRIGGPRLAARYA